ncbi:hypothetical protein RRG08_060022 [Elysia crispata]|uniref:Uncharacterized protein n=1 Tax=Elysia crispata TaxID=231223 RepID=A0AAE0YDV0_9GAST|nr:hypothetical protein RRG08_060022 [Elysia crispata]
MVWSGRNLTVCLPPGHSGKGLPGHGRNTSTRVDEGLGTSKDQNYRYWSSCTRVLDQTDMAINYGTIKPLLVVKIVKNLSNL